MKFKEKTIAFLGAGNMAEALISGILKNQLVPTDKVIATDIVASRLKQIAEKYGIQGVSSSQEAVKRGSVLILAVKPQNLKELFQEIATLLTPEKLVISIAAGVRTEKLEKLAGKKLRLVRAMPNMAALVQSGVAGLFQGPNASQDDLDVALAILSAVGKAIQVEKEEALDAVTALSGSGPAYFFYFIEALKEAGLKLGLSEEIADTLVMGTAQGALKLLTETKETPAELRKKVTSPGGTTEAALKVLIEKKFSSLIEEAIQAANKRSQELSQ